MTSKVIPLIALLSMLGVAACNEEADEGDAEGEEMEQSEDEGGEEDDG